MKQITAEIVQEVASDFRMDIPCTTSAPESDDAETRKKSLKALFRMIEELDGASEKQLDEAKLESGVKTE